MRHHDYPGKYVYLRLKQRIVRALIRRGEYRIDALRQWEAKNLRGRPPWIQDGMRDTVQYRRLLAQARVGRWYFWLAGLISG